MSRFGNVALAFLCAGLITHLIKDAARERDMHARVARVEAREHSNSIRLMAIEQMPYANIYDVNLIGMRTKCLRDTLETLVSTWPGRARLPEPCGAWPVWPRPGESLAEIIQP